jgi:hypothetical protein
MVSIEPKQPRAGLPIASTSSSHTGLGRLVRVDFAKLVRPAHGLRIRENVAHALELLSAFEDVMFADADTVIHPEHMCLYLVAGTERPPLR